MARRIAWSMFALTLLLLAAQAYFVIASGTPLKSAKYGVNSFPLITLGTALGALVGAAVVTRDPTNRVGWLFCAGPLGTALGLAAEAFSIAVGRHDYSAPRALLEPAVVLSYCFGAVWALTFVAGIFLVVPTGRLPSRRWRPVVVSLAAPLVLSAVALVSFASTHVLHVDQDEAGVAWYYVVALGAAWVLVALNIAVTSLSVVLRLRRSTGVEHQQLRWISTAAAVLAAATIVAIVVPSAVGDSWLIDAFLYVAYVGVPVAAGVAVLRYRLYDIDLVISRTLLLAFLLAFVATGYVAAVVTVGGVLGDRVSESFIASLLTTVAVALVFQPVRLRAVRAADRVAFGKRAAPYEALADLSRGLGESPDPASLLPVLAEASAQVAGAVRATATLHGLTGPDRVASWPAAQAPATATGTVVCVPVRDVHGTLGEISVEMPAGRALRGGERAVLEDLAGQAGFAFRNVRLQVELAERVEELRGRTGDLVESRRRLITAGDAERRRIERAIADTVVSHLEPLPGALHRLATEGSTIQGEALGPVLAGSGAALEALRDLTRGVFPAQLARGGLGPALTSYLGTADSAGHLRLDPSVTGRRFDERVEAAGYVCVTEAVRQLPPPVQVSVAVRDDWLELRIGGHCSGEFALSHVRDRVEVAGGTLSEVVVSDQVTLDVRLPAGREDVVPAQKRPGANAPVSRG